jgi:hypothetical protein
VSIEAPEAMTLQAAWFDCRAVAESAKTLSWRYMMGSAPYHRDRTNVR